MTPGASSKPHVVALSPAMMADLMALSKAAHWNQNEADWQAMLELGNGWGVQVQPPDGVAQQVASTVVLPYGARFAWVSMVLVLPEWREQGLASTLLRVALANLRERGLFAVLDATPAGHSVYRSQGFVDSWGFGRWRCAAVAARAAEPPADWAAGVRVRPLSAQDWSAVDALDAPAFGASRLPLLQRLAQRLPEAAWGLEHDGRLVGFMLGRDGRTALQLGPLVAADETQAAVLIAMALPTLRERAARQGLSLVVDLREGQPQLQAWLQGQGFAFERPFTRMVHGATQAPGDASHVVLVAGPELG